MVVLWKCGRGGLVYLVILLVLKDRGIEEISVVTFPHKIVRWADQSVPCIYGCVLSCTLMILFYSLSHGKNPVFMSISWILSTNLGLQSQMVHHIYRSPPLEN